jgi:uncharacterized membrane protein YcaP (DUF421 family)
MDFVWNAIAVFLGGFFLIRIIGRKSVSQLTVASTVIMIAVGAILVQPIVVDTVPRTLIVIAIFIAILIIMEYLQIKLNFLEKLFHGKAIVVVKNGQLVTDNLKKIRLTADKLEMQIRQVGVSRIADIKIGTIEPNGQFGYELMPDARPLTVGEFKKLMGNIIPQPQNQSAELNDNIFEELVKGNNINHTKKLK